MKFLHTADWHIGKKLHNFDLNYEEDDAFKQIERIAEEEKVDAIIIAGDLYDRLLPSQSLSAKSPDHTDITFPPISFVAARPAISADSILSDRTNKWSEEDTSSIEVTAVIWTSVFIV